MLPFPQLVVYGNVIDRTPKIQYTFENSTPVSLGSVSGTLSGGTYLTIPVSGYTTGIQAATLTLPSALVLGTSDYSIEATFYVNSTTNGYSSAVVLGSLTTLRIGDNGFGNRLQAASNASSSSLVYSLNQTRASLYHTVHTAKWQRESGISKFFFDGVQTNFAVGTGTSYTNTSIADTQNIASLTTITIGASNMAISKFTVDY